VTVPLQTDASMPYGLVYANEPTVAATRFVNAVRELI